MGIRFGDASTPPYVTTPAFQLWVAAGLLVVLAACLIVDKVGNVMYRKGYARPFFFRGHRIHHFWIYLIIPSCYVALFALVLTGHVQLIWTMFWYRLVFLASLVAACVAVDFIGDGLRLGFRRAILVHEWIYFVIPLYIASYIVTIYV